MNLQHLNNLCAEYLASGKEYYGLTLGIVSRIKDERYTVVAVDSNTGMPDPGTVYDLRAVYCREVIECGETLSIARIDATPGMRLHPLYASLPCEAYISTPLKVAGEVWGTLNYTSILMREQDFTAEDIVYIERQAADISAAIQGSGVLL